MSEVQVIEKAAFQPDPAPAAMGEPPEARYPIDAVPVRYYGQWIAAAIVGVFAAGIVYALAINPNINYAVVGEYLFAPTVLHGLLLTFELTAIAMVAGTAIGLIAAVWRMSSNRILQAVAGFYIWFFRGVPLLVQLLLWGNFALLFRHLGVGIPFTNLMVFQVDTNAVLSTFLAACIGLALHEGAYMAEVIRGGILSVDAGQREAATALGMRGSLAMRRIVLPQALRVIIPPTGNQLITLLKATSLVSVIAGGELMTAVNDIAAVNYMTIEMLFVATFWYVVAVSVLSIIQRFLEKRVSRGFAR